jgi:cytochrome c peroxidase
LSNAQQALAMPTADVDRHAGFGRRPRHRRTRSVRRHRQNQGPVLRGLAGRAPNFHNGSAATLLDVVNFYDKRFGIRFTDTQKADLVAFLQTL